MAEIVVRVRSDGTIEAVTHGLKGDACLDYVQVLENLTAARAVDSYYTDEYYEGRERVHVRPTEVQPQVDVGGSGA